ncbi:dihydrofolate reductase family protein [Phytoactinopolyspora mesophila]|uniref:Riboflavin biosynthesis protein RibD n=1 Tax=Phytoactinopolyspora mesophila TaxID=2650750 RepID=A0A7K3MBL2_9ACTN|nr:dihydrofolate reductase family protein [Phytoactinopolyspora mesophila]NDL60711.1 riboflavin biosynthesis protein RibD [Phytoactinopolyspora mesophila]
MNQDNHRRTVAANISLSLDGRINGATGKDDMSWIVPHAVTDVARDTMVRQTETATTVLLGRKNYEGFSSYWPAVATDESAEPRDRRYAQWLDSVEKVVFSATLTDVSWTNARLADADPVTEARRLRDEPGGDIVVQNSSSVIRALLEADEIDRLIITQCPELVGAGAHLFSDGNPATSWSLTSVTPSETGALSVVYDRKREQEEEVPRRLPPTSAGR